MSSLWEYKPSISNDKREFSYHLLKFLPVSSDDEYNIADIELRIKKYVEDPNPESDYNRDCCEFSYTYSRGWFFEYENLKQVLHLLSLYPKYAFDIFDQITDKLKGCKKLVLEAVKLDDMIFCCIPLELQQDSEVQTALLEAFPESTRISDFLDDDTPAAE